MSVHPLLSTLENKHQIIWDWNGTLLNDLEHNVRTMNALLAASNLEPISIEKHREMFRFPVVEYYHELGFDISPENFLVLCEEFNAIYDLGVPECDLVPGIRDVLEHLNALGKTQSILSASHQQALEYAISHFGIADLFEYICGVADNTATSKLERGRQLMFLSHIPAEETVLVGDTDHDLEVGRALGIDVVLVDHGHQSYERLIAAHDRVVRCFVAEG